jgi:hypothetical protein
LCDDEDASDKEDDNDMIVTNFGHDDIFESESEVTKDKSREERKRAAEEGSDENDSLLVGYDTDSIISL